MPTIPLDAHPVCPAEQALDLVSSKWTARIVFRLHQTGVLRFRELQRAIGAITQKELTKQLRRLERFGVVDREVFAEVPPRVEYRLTKLGATLVEPLTALSSWAEKHGRAVEQHRQRFDASADASRARKSAA